MFVAVCINTYFVIVQAFVFTCAQRSSWTGVCVSMHESWAQIPSFSFFFFKSKKSENLRQVCPDLEAVVARYGQ